MKGRNHMIVHLNGDFETVDYAENRSVLLYDNVQDEEYPIHWHNAIEIIMPLTNSYHAVCNGRDYYLEERDILIIPAGTLHSLNAQPGRRLIFLCDNRSLDGNPALSDISSLLAEPLLIDSGYDKEFRLALANIIKDIYTLYSNFEGMSEVYIYIKLLTLLARIKDDQINTIKYDSNGKYADIFLLITRYIEKNYMHDITLDDLAEMAGYSKYHFSRIFKKYSSDTFINCLNRRRIKAVELMLLDDDVTITDAAMQAGFTSLTTFNRVFKEIKGYTPSEFRKLYKTFNSRTEDVTEYQETSQD